MPYEATIPFPEALRGISLTAPPARPAAPLAEAVAPAPPAPVVSPVTCQEGEAIERVLDGLREAAADLRAGQRQAREEMRRAVVELAVAVASHLVHERIAEDVFAVEALVQKVVRRLEPREEVTVYLNPEDLLLLQRRLGDQPLLPPHSPEARLAPDPALRRGDCRAECGDVGVLWSLGDQLRDIRRHLLRVVAEAAGECAEAAGEPGVLKFSGS